MSSPDLSDQPSGPPVGRVIAMPADTNPEGDIFGGWLLAHMDLAGATPAAAWNDVTVGVALIPLSLPRGKVTERFGGWDRYVI